MSTQSINAELSPGSMGLVGLCWELLGGDHVIPGDWPGPVTVTDVSQDEIDTIIALAAEKGVTLTAKERIVPNPSN